jgi:hypothetical protein
MTYRDERVGAPSGVISREVEPVVRFPCPKIQCDSRPNYLEIREKTILAAKAGEYGHHLD